MIMNCNKIKQKKVSEKDVLDAVKGSKNVEASADGKRLRRFKNAPLPEKPQVKKREAKAASKEETKRPAKSEGGKEEESDVECDAHGNPVLVNADLENPYYFKVYNVRVIVHFNAGGVKDGEEYKVNWKEVE